MPGTTRTLLIGTSAIFGIIGCDAGDMEMAQEQVSEEEVALGLDYNTERVVVGFHSAAPSRLSVNANEVLVRELHAELGLATLLVPEGMDAAQLVTMLRSRSDIRFAELDRVRSVTGFEVNDPNFGSQWNMDAIGAADAWDQSYDGATTIVAVIDTGVSDGGQDGLDLFEPAGWDFVGDDDDPSDANGHGTHVAGTIAQRTGNGIGVTGVAHRSQIMAVRVLDANGSGYVSDVAEGILWAVDHEADVINLSLGSSVSSQAEQEAIQYAMERNVLVVAASGNEYQANGVSYPAAYPEVLAVGATNASDEVVPYSNRGPEIDLVAPGGDVSRDDNGDGMVDGILQETVMNGQWDYYLFQGTSMAAPHVAGAAAVLMGMDVSADEAREILEVTAADIDEDGLDSNSGWGRLDLAAAVEELESRLDSPVVEEPDDEDEDIDEDDHDHDHDHDVDEPGDDSDFPIESRPDRHDEIAPSVTHIRARRCSHGIHINVQTDEMAGVMVCEAHSDNCAKSPPGTDHKLQLETDEAELELRTRDYAKNVRVMPLAL